MEAMIQAQAVALLRATSEENISFSTYAVMSAVAGKKESPSFVALSIETGYSYHALRNLVERSPWFEKVSGGLLICLRVSKAGRGKLKKIAEKVAAYGVESGQVPP